MSARDIPDSTIVRLKTGVASFSLSDAMQALQDMRDTSPEDTIHLQNSLANVTDIESLITKLRAEIERKLK
ncbi:hypothetical protein HYW84_01225 [Candidatus Peregrinibacteria bacterium]|nr:hypothetical protein [Candidatus Peregrinibacteria bacterium]